MYGTKIYNHKKQEVGLLISTWINVYADDKVDLATCVDSQGKKYNIKCLQNSFFAGTLEICKNNAVFKTNSEAFFRL
jgi:hypothetical protein